MVATNIFHYFFYAKNPQHFRILDAWDAGPPSTVHWFTLISQLFTPKSQVKSP